MIHPSQYLNQRIKGYYCPTELIKRSETAFTFEALDERNRQEVILKIFLKQDQAQIQDLINQSIRDQAPFRSPFLMTPLDFGTHKNGSIWLSLIHI